MMNIFKYIGGVCVCTVKMYWKCKINYFVYAHVCLCTYMHTHTHTYITHILQLLLCSASKKAHIAQSITHTSRAKETRKRQTEHISVWQSWRLSLFLSEGLKVQWAPGAFLQRSDNLIYTVGWDAAVNTSALTHALEFTRVKRWIELLSSVCGSSSTWPRAAYHDQQISESLTHTSPSPKTKTCHFMSAFSPDSLNPNAHRKISANRSCSVHIITRIRTNIKKTIL